MEPTSPNESKSVPFKIAIADDQLKQLKERLTSSRLPDELDGVGDDYGVPLSDIRRLLSRWINGYDWRKYEKQLNDELPQFQRYVEVKGFDKLNIHYIHKRSEVEGAIPLLFLHGWPGSFIEVRKILPLLIQKSPEHPSFHVVAISLPNFGFSEGATKKGFGLTQYAEVANKVMLSLGYEEYVTQSGDWSYGVARKVANDYGGKNNRAWHTNFEGLHGAPPSFFRNPLLYLENQLRGYTPAEKAGLERTKWFREKSSGYFALQTTKPQTLGYSLADSPVGLLAWLYEKLVDYSDNYPWEDDEVLTWVSIYWFSTAGPAASVRIYYEAISEALLDEPPSIPHGVSFFPKEVVNLPRLWTRTKYRIFVAEHAQGGHYAAYEKPNELVGDVRKMFGKGGPAYGVIHTNPGY
ncbi:alpha/beta-hydrolase [Agrocybe pediades]|nr:alpha/beta-hydrolase [Agrocybe pediades]